jgi:hypothetical protein
VCSLRGLFACVLSWVEILHTRNDAHSLEKAQRKDLWLHTTAH